MALKTNTRSLIRSLFAGLALALIGACAQVPTAPEVAAPAPVVVQAPAPAPEPVVVEQPAPPPPAPVVVVQAPPPPPADVWVRVRAGFKMTNLNGPLVQQWEQYYSTRPDYVARMVERGSHFLYHVMEELERRGMPSEIALLPMIESAYNPQAYSRAHAAGMWQFIPSTGKHYGLQQNFWYDGRRDVLAATSAALDYLEKLYKQFGDWNHALASYNWGEGAVARAIARNQAKGLPADYESLAMPAETRNYLPKLQAVKNIIANPEQYGIKLADVPNRPYFATVTTPRHMDVKVAAALAEISIEEFKFLNPAHNKPVIRADGSEIIVLPVEKVMVFQRNLTAHEKPLVSWQAYTVKRSDKADQIAAKHGMSVAQLKAANNIAPNKNIVAGQTLMVPLKGTAEPYLPDLPAPKVTLARAKKAKCYQTRNGVRKAVACATGKKKKTMTVKAAPKKTATTVAAQSR
jgi:membrane-bound lytic murein transglycosylase D